MPADFSKNVGRGKTYDTARPDGHALWEAVRLRLQAANPSGAREPQGEIFGDPRLVHPQLGAGAFRLLITDLYRRRCAFTGDDALPTLEAAHIRPLAEGGMHRVDNGLLLRADVRRLFDSGYLSADAENRVLVSASLERDFSSTGPYTELAHRPLRLPERPQHRPRREFLDWHRAKVFRA